MNNNQNNGQNENINNNNWQNNSPMEQARQNSQRGFNSNPYIQNQDSNLNMGQNPYYNDNNSMNSQNPQQEAPTSDSILGSFDTSNFIKGALIGAVGAYLLTNENAQKTIFKTVAKGSEMFQAGIEEMKERFEDAKAEMDAER